MMKGRTNFFSNIRPMSHLLFFALNTSTHSYHFISTFLQPPHITIDISAMKVSFSVEVHYNWTDHALYHMPLQMIQFNSVPFEVVSQFGDYLFQILSGQLVMFIWNCFPVLGPFIGRTRHRVVTFDFNENVHQCRKYEREILSQK